MATRNVIAGPNGSMAFQDEVSGGPETTIQVGDTVQWTSPGDEHTIVSDNTAPFNTLNPPLNGDVQQGSPPYQRTFNQAGNYGYHCSIHGGDPVAQVGMYGIIHVNAGGSNRGMKMAVSAGQSDTAKTAVQGGTLSLANPTTSNWFAWNNLQPPGPPSFHIIGDVQVPNPGVDLLLTEHVPPSIDPTLIVLDLHFIQLPGIWPQMVVQKQVRFDKARAWYSRAQVLNGHTLIADIPVVDVV